MTSSSILSQLIRKKGLPSAQWETKVTGNEETANCGHREGSCSRGAKCAFKHDDQSRGKGTRETSDCGHQVQRKDNPLRNQKSEDGQAETRPGKRVDFFRGSCVKDKNCDYWHPPFCRFQKRGQCRSGTKCPFVHIGKDDRQSSHTQQQQSNKKNSDMITTSSAGGTPCRFPTWRQSMPRETWSSKRELDLPQVSVLVSS